MEGTHVVIDHIDDIQVSAEVHHNNLSILRSLEIGMFHLAASVRRREVEELERFGRDEIRGFFDFGNDLELMLGCVFDWFSISLVSYMRTIQLMHLMETNGWGLENLKQKSAQRKLRNACRMYISRIAPDVLEWRNKVGAHRVATDPRSDSLALLKYSTFPSVGYQSPYYGVGHFSLTLGDGSSAALPNWSLTQKYEELIPRYWPGRKLAKLNW